MANKHTQHNYERNANQSYNKISPHTSHNGHHQTINAGEGVEKREPSCTVGGSEVKATDCLQARRPEYNSWVGKIPWRRKWQPTPVFLPGESHGRRSLVGYSPQGHKESHTTERLHFHFSLHALLAGM